MTLADCKDELLRFLKKDSRSFEVVVMPDFFLDRIISLDWDATAFSCAMRIALPGPDLFAEDVESDLYAAIDLVAKKIEQQIRKRHNKYKARKHKQPARGKRTRQDKAL